MGLLILAWDAPNIDMTLAQLLGRRPGQADRPDMRAVLRWLASRKGSGNTAEAAVFVNVPREHTRPLQSWVAFLQSIGWRVFAKPKDGESDIDADLVEYLRRRASEATELVVASNDARALAGPLRDLAGRVRVTVLGFEEFAGELADSQEWEFIDLEDLPQVIGASLSRTRLNALPAEGRWFEPRISLDEALDQGSGPGEPDASAPSSS